MNINSKNVSTLIHFMEGLNDPEFNMLRYFRECKTPSCALGWATTIPKFGYEHEPEVSWWQRTLVTFSDRVFGMDAYHNVFTNRLSATIRTPQQWAVHARNFLTANGFEVTELIKNAAPQGTTTPASTSADGKDPAVAAPDAFKVFMGKVLEDAQVKQDVIAAEAVSGIDERSYPTCWG